MAAPGRLHYQAVMGLNLHIRELRKGRGLTLEQLAEMVGVSVPHLSEVERGKKNLNNHLLVRLSGALNVRPEALLSDQDDDLAALRSAMTRLSEADRRRVEEFARALLASQQERGQAE